MDELENGLKQLGYLSLNETLSNVKIVKRVGNKKDGYRYSFASNNIVYRDVLSLMSEQALISFLDLNKYNYEKMLYFFEKAKTRTMNRLKNATIKDNKYVSGRIGTELAIIDEILNILKNLVNEEKRIGYVNSDLIPRSYDLFLEEFVNSAIYYGGEYNKSINTYGLVTLASSVSDLCKLDGVKLPKKTEKYNIGLKKVERFIEKRSSMSDYLTTTEIKSIEDDDIDPDYYMFLEEEDFIGLYPDTPEYDGVLEEQLDNLEAMKKKH